MTRKEHSEVRPIIMSVAKNVTRVVPRRKVAPDWKALLSEMNAGVDNGGVGEPDVARTE
jgi:hypothetical protein